MLNSDELTLKKVIELTRSSEEKFKQGDFKAAIEDKRSVRIILNSKTIDKNIIEKFKDELSKLYNFKFDLINDYKLKISEFKKNEIIQLLEKKGAEKYNKGDYKAAIKALRRSEKYLSN